MRVLVTGGCKNGKSTYAENLAVTLSGGKIPLYYIATMVPHDEEDEERIRRHRESRKDKGFETVEIGTGIFNVTERVPARGSFLLDSTTALLANEMFGEGAESWTTVEEKLVEPILRLSKEVEHLVVVSDYLYSEAAIYSEETLTYMKNLAMTDQSLAAQFDLVVELCAGNVIIHKGQLSEKYNPSKKNSCKPYAGFCMSISMFSVIPAPFVWKEEALPYVLRFFPLVGALIGGIWFGLIMLLFLLPFHGSVRAALFALLLPGLSGFIHMDGYMDVSDAICSRADLAKKRKILKDPNTGAFAVIAFGVYLLLSFAAGVALFGTKQFTGTTILPFESSFASLLLIPVVSRCLSGLFMLKGRLMSANGYAAAYQKCAGKWDFLLFPVVLLLAIGLGFTLGGMRTAAGLMLQALTGGLAGLYAAKELGGINGDVSGFIITISELCGILLFTAIQ